MRKFATSIILFILLFCLGQDVVFDVFTAENGLPENTGQAIIQDRLGFMWIGGQNGLSKFNGSTFEIFQHHPQKGSSISNNQVEGLHEDTNGNLWVSTRSGLNLYNPSTRKFQKFLFSDSTYLNWFGRSFLETEDQVWINNFYGFACFNKSDFSFQKFVRLANKSNRAYTAMASWKDKVIFAVNDSLFTWNGSQLRFLSKSPARIVDVVSVGSDCFVLTDAGCYFLDESGIFFRSKWRELDEKFVLCFHKDNQNRDWFGCTDGLYLYQDGRLLKQFVPSENCNLSHRLILSIEEDRSGLIWVGTAQGVNVFNDSKQLFTRISDRSDWPYTLVNKQVEVLHLDMQNNLWIGSSSGLQKVVVDDSKSSAEFQKDVTWIPEVGNVDALYSLNANQLLIGTNMGELFVLNKLTNEVSLKVEGQGLKQLRGLYYNPILNELWLGYSGGIRIVDATTFKQKQDNPLTHVEVVQMEFCDGDIWVGSPNDIYRINPNTKKFSKLNSSNYSEITNTMLTDVLMDGKYIWMSTFGGGIYQLDKEKNLIKRYDEFSGLPNNNVWSVYKDEHGFLWIATDNGLARFDSDVTQVIYYSKSDGLNFNDFSMSAHIQLKSGELLFGNPEGITMFQPSEFPAVIEAPRVHLLELFVNGQFRNGDFGIEKNLELNASENSLKFVFSSLDFSSSSKQKIAYRISDGDDDWVIQNGSDITFKDLQYGKYPLEVKAINAQGIWSEVPFILKFEILTPFYLRWWFFLILTIILLVVTRAVVLRVNRKKYEVQLESLRIQQKIQEERVRISRDLHDNVGSQLTKIISDLDVLSSVQSQPGLSKVEQVEDIRNYTFETINLLRDTIWAIHEESCSIGSFSNKIEVFLENYLKDIVH
ncbi:MAG: two-component regulator propeller domain-containing protein, partial [Flavobacteriales bacterium]